MSDLLNVFSRTISDLNIQLPRRPTKVVEASGKPISSTNSPGLLLTDDLISLSSKDDNVVTIKPTSYGLSSNVPKTIAVTMSNSNEGRDQFVTGNATEVILEEVVNQRSDDHNITIHLIISVAAITVVVVVVVLGVYIYKIRGHKRNPTTTYGMLTTQSTFAVDFMITSLQRFY